MTEHPLISIKALGKDFKAQGAWGRQSTVHAVRAVNLDIARGETLGVVGESGCGKSTLGRMVIGLLEPTSGDVLIDGRPLYDKAAHANYRDFRRGLAGHIQMIFQDPYSSLNPRMRIGASVAEPLLCAPEAGGRTDPQPIKQLVADMLVQVGMEPETAARYPHEFSGGQRQRLAIARALITRPAFVVCDEPTSSLDASVQSQVLNLLQDMQEELGLTYMFISHDLAVVRHMSDRVAVMYRGFLVEEGDAEGVFSNPLHPYTRLLLDSVPGAGSGSTGYDSSAQKQDGGQPHSGSQAVLDALSSDGSALDSDQFCPFVERCPEAMPRCGFELPQLMKTPSRQVRCFLYEEQEGG